MGNTCLLVLPGVTQNAAAAAAQLTAGQRQLQRLVGLGNPYLTARKKS